MFVGPFLHSCCPQFNAEHPDCTHRLGFVSQPTTGGIIMGSRLVPLRLLLQQGSLAVTRAVAVASLRELPAAVVSGLGHHAQPTTLSQGWHLDQRSLLQGRSFHATGSWSAGLEVKVRHLRMQ